MTTQQSIDVLARLVAAHCVRTTREAFRTMRAEQSAEAGRGQLPTDEMVDFSDKGYLRDQAGIYFENIGFAEMVETEIEKLVNTD